MPTLPTVEQEVLIRFRADNRQLKRGAQQTSAALDKTAKSSEQAARHMNQAAMAGEQIGRIGSALPGQLGPVAGAVGALTGAFKGAEGSLLAFGLAAVGVVGGLIKFGPELKNIAEELFGVGHAMKFVANQAEEMRQAQSNALSAGQALRDTLFPEEAKARKFAEDRRVLEESLKAELDQITRLYNIAYGNAETQKEVEAAQEKASARRTAANERFNQSLMRLDAQYSKAISKEKKLTQATRERVAAGGGGPGYTIGGTFAPGVTVSGLSASDQERELDRLMQGSLSMAGTGTSSVMTLPGVAGHAGMQIRTDALGDYARSLRDFGSTAEQVAEQFQTMGQSFTDAFEAWGRGEKTIGKAMKDFMRQSVAEALRLEAKKFVARAAAEAIALNPGMAALHLAAAASLSAAAGAIGGGGGAGGIPSGGGGMPGAAAGAFQGGGSGQTREVIIIGSDSMDDDVRGKRRKVRSLLDRANAELGQGNRVGRY